MVSSDDLYKDFLISLDEAVQLSELVWDDNGQPKDFIFLDVNPAYEKHTGLIKEEIVGKRIKDILPVVDQVWLDSYGEVVLENKPKQFEEYNSGTNKFYQVKAKPLGGNKFAAILQDITENKKIKKALKKSENHYHKERDKLSSLINSIPDEIWFADLNKKFTLANKSALEEFNMDFPDRDVEEMAINNLVYDIEGNPRPVDDAPPLKALKGEHVKNQEEIIQTPSTGELRYRQVSASPVKDMEGKIIGSVSVVRDITNNKKAEEKLKNQKNELANVNQALKEARENLEIKIEERTEKLKLINLYNRSLIEASLDPLVTIGPDGKITDVNNSTQEVTGFNREELIGTDFSKYFTDVNEAREGYKRVYKEGSVRDYPLDIVHKDGSITPVLYNASVYKDDNGEVIGVFAAARDIRKIKKAEEEIQRLANVVESSDDAIITKTLDGNILNWNKGAEEVYGYSADEVIGKNMSILIPPFMEKEFNNLMDGIKSGKRIEHFETLRVKKDGSTINVSITLSPVHDTKGNLIAISTIARNVTARKRIEEELKFANIYNRNLIESSLDPLVTIGPDGKITDVNKSTESVTGFKRNELIGTDFSDYFTEPEKAKEGYERVFKEYLIRDYPLEIQHIDGHVTPVLYNASVYKDESDKVVGVFAAARDISKVKKIEEQLRLVGKYNRGLIETSVDPLVTIGPNGKINDVNKATELVTGFGRDDLIGTDFSNYFTEPIKARDGYKQVFNEGIIRDYTLEIKHKNGHVTPVLYNASVYRDQSNKVIGVFAAARDITELKKAEDKLKKSEADLKQINETLEERVSERTKSLKKKEEQLKQMLEIEQKLSEELQVSNEELIDTQNKLQESINKLEISNRELEQFAYVASHDLQEPLRMVSSFTQLLEKRYSDQLDDDADEFIEFIIEGSNRMKDLIDDLLIFSRLNTQAKPFESLNIRESVNSVIKYLKPTIEENKAKLMIEDLPTINGDQSQIRQLFQNLISNSIKFHGDKSPEIHITCQNSFKNWLIGVNDNGIGIDPENQEKIFKIFNRLHTREEYPGTGIGLAICKRIVERHKGKIWVESEAGKGATFYFTIPKPKK